MAGTRSSSCWAARRCSSAWAAARPPRMAQGASAADLDFASVQRGNAEMQRRCQEVIDRCWALGETQPDPLHPRRGRGRPVQRGAGAGRTTASAARASICATCRTPSPACRRWRSGATRRRSATCWRSRRERPGALRGAVRARALPLRGARRGHRRQAAGGGRPAVRQRRRSTCRSTCCSASRRRCAADVKSRRADAAAARRWRRSTLADAGVPRAAAPDGGGQDLPHHHRRPHGGRPDSARPDGGPVAGAGGRLRGDADRLSTGYTGEAMAMGERTPLALIDAPASARMAVGEAITNIAAARDWQAVAT